MEYRETRQLDSLVELRYRPSPRWFAVCRRVPRRRLSRRTRAVLRHRFHRRRRLLRPVRNSSCADPARRPGASWSRRLPALLLAALPPDIARGGAHRDAPRQRGRVRHRGLAVAVIHRHQRLPRRVLVLRELALHSSSDRLLRDQRQLEPGAALLVARGRGAVLPDVAAVTRRIVRSREWRGRARWLLLRLVVLAAILASAAQALPTTATATNNRRCWWVPPRAYRSWCTRRL